MGFNSAFKGLMWILLPRLWDCVSEEYGLSILILYLIVVHWFLYWLNPSEEGRRHEILPELVFYICIISFAEKTADAYGLKRR